MTGRRQARWPPVSGTFPQNLDWRAVERLRGLFLAGQPQRRAYWESSADLAAYDVTLAERIGWKWDAVLAELIRRGWSPPAGPLLDFGCGSGVAGRRVIAAFGTGRFTTLRLHDRSPLAEEFARAQAVAAFPRLKVERVTASALEAETESVGTLVVSHVVSEMPAKELARLVALARRAEALLWVEPGTHADSHTLIGVREQLREVFEVIAPCTHQAACGLLQPGNERHWCHHFAKPPWEIFTDAAWAEFADRLGIDLRSLPYSFLVLQRRGTEASGTPLAPGSSRVIGEPRFYKGYAKLFSCNASGVAELTLQKRDAPEFFKALKDGETEPVQHWQREGDRIKAVGAELEQDQEREHEQDCD